MFTLKFLSQDCNTVVIHEGYDISLDGHSKSDGSHESNTVDVVEVRFTDPNKSYKLINQTFMAVGKGEAYKIAYIENSKGQTVEIVEPNRMKCFW